MTDPTPLVLAVALGGAALAAWLTPRHPLAAFGVLFLLAAMTRPTVATPLGTMRLEQPAIALVGVVLLVTGRLRVLASLPRWAWGMGACLAIYLAVLTVSSALVAPDPTASLRIVAWWAVSFASGLVAILLVGSHGRRALLPLGLVGAAVGGIGILTAILFLVAGPTFHAGIQDPDTILPRVHALTREANLYASFLAACVPFALELVRSARDRRIGIALAVIILIALPLGLTRGAFIGLGVGLVVYLGTLAWRRERAAPLAGLAAAVLLLTVVGVGVGDVLLPDPLERPTSSIAVGPTIAPSGSPAPEASGPVATPRPTLRPAPDTIAVRLLRVRPAIDDIGESPIIGLGAESFGQRHPDPDRPGAPDHLAILGIAVLYESGFVGVVALAAAFAILALALWRTSRQPPGAGAAAAYLASIATLLAAYQATNALHFAINWLIVGAAVALAARPPVEPLAETG